MPNDTDDTDDTVGQNQLEIPKSYQPDADRFGFDIPHVLRSVVGVRTEVPETAFTAQALGTERAGHGVVIDDRGIVLTIGYLVVEAETIWLLADDGGARPGHLLGYDPETGFGLVQALQPLNVPSIPLGSSADLIPGDDVIVAGAGGIQHALQARISARREFAGYWEYLLDDAIFTHPAHPLWGGAALIGEDGTLRGIGSLFVQQGEDKDTEGNMLVPVDILKPILDNLVNSGQSGKPARPWLGAYTAEAEDKVIVVGTWSGGPAEQAGIGTGDLILGVDGWAVSSMAHLFRKVWALGAAGVDVPLDIYRDGDVLNIVVTSGARGDYHTSPRLH